MEDLLVPIYLSDLQFMVTCDLAEANGKKMFFFLFQFWRKKIILVIIETTPHIETITEKIIEKYVCNFVCSIDEKNKKRD
jgi:hypothetical protein